MTTTFPVKPEFATANAVSKLCINPTVKALEAFEDVLASGQSQIAAIRTLLTFDGDLSVADFNKLRLADLNEVPAPTISLTKPITHCGKIWTSVEVNPSVLALEAFETALSTEGSEIGAVRILMTLDGDIPLEVVNKMRVSDFSQLSDKALSPLEVASTRSEAGGA